MNCSETQAHLSAYLDRQVSDDAGSRIVAHLQSCEDCASVLASYRAISELAGAESDPEPPPQLWSRVEQQLDADRVVRPAMVTSERRFSVRFIVAAATLLLAVGIGLISLMHNTQDHNHLAGEHTELAVDFDRYLDVYAEDPVQATRDLFSEYPAEEVEIEEATRRVGYRPVIANSLPAGYSVDSIHLMKMPCCTCIKTICSDDQGQPFVVFEHDAEQAVWFGNRVKTQCECDGMPTTVIEFNGQIAATWPVGKRSVTIVGAKDIDEVTKLMPYLGREPTSG
ncbi:MAG: zf-HC2 domain-containing protein [Planctomycetaceae bacterium]|nr:zf-HC2 domain-containing protein [Planctomycetaceae bacterium]